MPKVKVTSTMPIAADGIHVRKYVAGEIYDVSDELAQLMIASLKCAVIYVEKPVVEEIAKKEEKEATIPKVTMVVPEENKMVKDSPANKKPVILNKVKKRGRW